MAFFTNRETPEQEVARLNSASEGSKLHALSTLPVTIKEWPQDLVIELPWQATGHRVAVVPIKYHTSPQPADEVPRRRYDGSWDCVVVASDHPSYPVGGFHLSIPAAELVRGEKIDLFAAVAPF